jgi:hypothetical protein
MGCGIQGVSVNGENQDTGGEHVESPVADQGNREGENLASAPAAATSTPPSINQTYECECLDCGHVQSSEEHCANITCESCGGEMRRVDRPGDGNQSQDPNKTSQNGNDQNPEEGKPMDGENDNTDPPADNQEPQGNAGQSPPVQPTAPSAQEDALKAQNAALQSQLESYEAEKKENLIGQVFQLTGKQDSEEARVPYRNLSVAQLEERVSQMNDVVAAINARQVRGAGAAMQPLNNQPVSMENQETGMTSAIGTRPPGTGKAATRERRSSDLK